MRIQRGVELHPLNCDVARLAALLVEKDDGAKMEFTRQRCNIKLVLLALTLVSIGVGISTGVGVCDGLGDGIGVAVVYTLAITVACRWGGDGHAFGAINQGAPAFLAMLKKSIIGCRDSEPPLPRKRK